LYELLSENDSRACRIETKFVQQIELDRFEELEENDILFVDSSHVGKVHSDVLHIIFKVLRRLRKGVIVHIHDVLWPFEYPQSWLEEGRAFTHLNWAITRVRGSSLRRRRCGDFYRGDPSTRWCKPYK